MLIAAILISIFSFVSKTSDAVVESLVVKIKSAADLPRLEEYGQTELLFENIYRLQITRSFLSVTALSSERWVEFAERDGLVKTVLNASDKLFVLDDKDLTKQWYLPKIEIHKAWDKTIGSSNVIVAVVDTGIDAKHEDLSDGRVMAGYANYCQVKSSIFPDQCLVRMNGEFAAGVNSDDNGHGTIVAGLIGAVSNNNKGISGINWNVRLMPIKALDSTGSGYASDVASGIRWAADKGAKIINLSIGGPGLEAFQVIQEAVVYAFHKGALVVAAAGNDAAVNGGNLNSNPVSPVCADSAENLVIGVAALDMNDRRASFSNFGSNCIDISAPGTGTFVDRQQKQGLVSTYFDPTRPGEHNLYVYAAGTSVAAPIVSGVAALVISVFPDLDVKAVRDRLIASVDDIDQINAAACDGNTCLGQLGRGRINAYKAVTTPSVFTTGNLVRDAEGNIYLIERGLRRPVSALVYKQRFAGIVAAVAAQGDFDAIPPGDPVLPIDGTVIKDSQNPTVFLVEGGVKRAMSYLAFVSRRLKFQDVVVLPAEEVAKYVSGTDAPVIDGALVKSANNPAVYVINKGTRQLLSYFVFQKRFLSPSVAVLSDDELAQKYAIQPQGYLYPPSDGTLIRGDSSATVYLIEGGKRRGLNLTAFQSRGYKFTDINVLHESEVDGYQLGEDLVE